MLVLLLLPPLGAEAANPDSVTVGPQTGSPLTYGTVGSASYLVTVSKSGASGIVTLTVTGLPAGATGSFNPSEIDFSGGTTSSTSTLTVTSSTTTPAGSTSFTVTASRGTTVRTATGTLAIGKRALTVLGVKANNKVYDGMTDATLDLSDVTYSGFVLGDPISLVVSGVTGVFANKHVGTGKTVNVSGFAPGGAAKDNYTVTQPTATADITPLPISVSAVSASKTYDGTTSSAGVPAVTSGSLAPGDTGAFTQTFDTKSVGTGKTLTPAGHVTDGNGGSNYSVTFVPVAEGTITARELTVTATADNKAYDGTTTASVTLHDDRVAGDVLTVTYESAAFADASVGNGKTVTVTGIAVSGADAANYTLKSTTATATADITKVSATVVVTSSKNPSDPDEAVTFTATVSPAAASGTIQFKDGATNLGTPVTLSGGIATYTTSTLSGGTHHITAVYSGDATHETSTSSVLDQVVARDSSTTTVTSSPNPSVFGQAVTFTATVNHTDATGTITFKNGAATLHTCTPVSGSCSFTTSALGVGTHVITAVYSGSADYGSSAGTLAGGQVVDKANTTTSITSDLSAATLLGQPYTVAFTVTAVAPGAGTPAGNVTVSDGSATCTATVAEGSCQLVSMSAGSKTIVASYSGDASFNSSASSGVAHAVNKASTEMTLTSSPNASVYGQMVTFTATVCPQPIVIPNLKAAISCAPTGTVAFHEDSESGALLGTGTLSGGVATFSTSLLGNGEHFIVAVYGGDDNYLTSSQTLTQIVVQATSVTTVTSSLNPSVFGQAVTFTAMVCQQASAQPNFAKLAETCAPTGTVTFKDGDTELGTATLSDGAATFETSALATGNHPITAVYSGDANFVASTSAVLTQVVNKVDQTIVFGALSDKTVGDADFTVSATGGASGNPVVFTSSTPGACTTSGTNGSTIHLVAAGKCTIVANQAGNDNYNAAAPVSQSFTVKPAATELPKTGDPWAAPLTLAILVLALGSTALMVARVRVSAR